MFKLKFQYFGQLMQRADSLEKTLIWEGLKAGGQADNRGWDDWIASLSQWTWVWASSRRWWRTGKMVCCSPWGHKDLDRTEQLKNSLKYHGFTELLWNTNLKYTLIKLYWCYKFIFNSGLLVSELWFVQINFYLLFY